jgi:hypothetical protein
MGLHEIKKLQHSKGNNYQNDETECEKISASYSSDKGLVSRIHKELKKNQNQKKK